MSGISFQPFLIGVFLAGLLAGLRSEARGAVAAQAVVLPPPSNRIFETHLGEVGAESYARAAEALISAFERSVGQRLAPSLHKRAGLKVYSDSGPGLATPPALVRGVIAALERRGFARENLVIVDLNAARLRSSGFLPSLADGGTHFESVPVIALENGQDYDPEWFYDSPLPARISSALNVGEESEPGAPAMADDRQSFLPKTLLLGVDFWINMPSCSDHPVLGVNGALVNATLWNASNTQRFFRSPATGPAAVAEMAAIPELRGGMVCTIMSLERYQFIGGPIFNSLYTISEPLVWLSDNAVMIDALMRERIDAGRRNTGFRVLPEDLRLLGYAQQLGLGSADRTQVEWVRINSDPVQSN